MGYPVVRTA